MTRADFEELVERAWLRIPEEFRSRVQNLVLGVEDEPSADALRSGRVPSTHTLLGLYQGVPLPKRQWAASPLMPDRITLYQGPIERAVHGEEAIEEQVALTLFHELGHYFGLDEAEVRRAEKRWRGR
jgi:predicted Zn-dependent protease with MMP-like domain